MAPSRRVVIADTLLQWYDGHARDLPWRERAPDPYRVWLSEIMLQQTTTTAVAPYYARFLERWPDVEALAAASDAEVMSAWAGLGYYARARNLLACARTIAAASGRFPDTESGLRALPGVGPYTAAAIAAIAFDRRAVVVDGNVERVISRLFAIETPLPASRPAIRAHADEITPHARPGDFAQAMMDLGATICVPARPVCLLCPLRDQCRANASGLQNDLPRRSAKTERPTRYGTAFVARDAAGAVLVRTRAPNGLLGGMTEFPGAWPLDERPVPGRGGDGAHAPFVANWQSAGRATHGFTHFQLELDVLTSIEDTDRVTPPEMRWVSRRDLAAEAFPTLMRRVAEIAGIDLPGSFSGSGGLGRERAPPPAARANAADGAERPARRKRR